MKFTDFLENKVVVEEFDTKLEKKYSYALDQVKAATSQKAIGMIREFLTGMDKAGITNKKLITIGVGAIVKADDKNEI